MSAVRHVIKVTNFQHYFLARLSYGRSARKIRVRHTYRLVRLYQYYIFNFNILSIFSSAFTISCKFIQFFLIIKFTFNIFSSNHSFILGRKNYIFKLYDKSSNKSWCLYVGLFFQRYLAHFNNQTLKTYKAVNLSFYWFIVK